MVWSSRRMRTSSAYPILALAAPGLIVVLTGLANPPAWCLDFPQHRFVAPAALPEDVCARAQREAGADAPAYLLFTSGSTGAPKGIAITHANALAYFEAVRERYRPTEVDRFSQSFDLTFDLSVHDMFLCWSAGACLYPLPPTAGLGVGSFIRKARLTFWFAVPSTAALMARLGELTPGAFPDLHWSLFCGEALPAKLAKAWQVAAPTSVVENLYGPTEATIAFTAYRVPPDISEEGVVPIGHPFPGQSVAVVDEQGVLLPNGEVGELCLGGSQIAPGYWGQPRVTAERFRGPLGTEERTPVHWYRTGDLAVMTADHGLCFRGRADRQVKIRGYRVELQEVEDALRTAGGINLAAALPWSPAGDDARRAIVAFVPEGTSRERVLAGCRARLPDYMVPAHFREVEEWPLNASGKTDYAQFKALLEGSSDAR